MCGLLARVWDVIQVKRSGRYPRHRLLALREYSSATPLWRVVAVAVPTLLLSLVTIALFEVVELNPPSAGLEHNRSFYVREFMTYFTFCVILLQQFCVQVGPALPMSALRLIATAVWAAAVNVAFTYVLASAVGFPLPFTMQLSAPVHLMLESVALIISWRAHVREKPRVIADIARAGTFFACQYFMIVIYPVYYYVFTLVPDASVPRLAYLLLLSVIKLIDRLIFLHMTRKADGGDELTPMMVVLNADVMGALFVAFCMQYSPSLLTAACIAAVKVLQAALSLRDIYSVAQTVMTLRALIQERYKAAVETSRDPKTSVLDKLQRWKRAASLAL